VMALTRAAEVATLLGQGDRAQVLLRESLALLCDIGGRAWVADSVEMTALVLGSGGRHRPAARLLGAGEALRHASGESAAVRPIHGEVERHMDQAARALGPEDFAEEWRRGAEMPSEEAVVYALDELQHLRGPGKQPRRSTSS
jgi:hypothetical protein